jgi:hypothetical protein
VYVPIEQNKINVDVYCLIYIFKLIRRPGNNYVFTFRQLATRKPFLFSARRRHVNNETLGLASAVQRVICETFFLNR